MKRKKRPDLGELLAEAEVQGQLDDARERIENLTRVNDNQAQIIEEQKAELVVFERANQGQAEIIMRLRDAEKAAHAREVGLLQRIGELCEIEQQLRAQINGLIEQLQPLEELSGLLVAARSEQDRLAEQLESMRKRKDVWMRCFWRLRDQLEAVVDDLGTQATARDREAQS
jgi:TolA-binding protein